MMKTGAGLGLLLLSLVDHLTELPVVQPVVPAGVEFVEGDPHLLVSQVLADRHELLNRGIMIITQLSWSVLCSVLRDVMCNMRCILHTALYHNSIIGLIYHRASCQQYSGPTLHSTCLVT